MFSVKAKPAAQMPGVDHAVGDAVELAPHERQTSSTSSALGGLLDERRDEHRGRLQGRLRVGAASSTASWPPVLNSAAMTDAMSAPQRNATTR